MDSSPNFPRQSDQPPKSLEAEQIAISQKSFTQSTKTSHLKIQVIVLSTVILSIIFFGVLLIKNGEKVTTINRGNSILTQILTPTPTFIKEKSNNTPMLSLLSLNLNDPNTVFYIPDGKKLLTLRLDGSPPREITSFPQNVGQITVLADHSLIVHNNLTLFKKTKPGTLVEEVSSEDHYWQLNLQTNEKKEIDSKTYYDLVNSLTSNQKEEKIYTKELPDGQAEIILDRRNGSPTEKIGILKEKLISMPVCETDESCIKKFHPSEFIPSPNGKYLLNKPPGGGGLGSSAIVISRDGSKVYDIKFYWYVSHAFWVGDNELLTFSQDRKLKLDNFSEDGTFKESLLADNLGHYDMQSLFWSKKLVLFTYYDPNGLALFDLNNKQFLTLDKESGDDFIKRNNLQDEIKNYKYPNYLFGFKGWNKKEDKIFYDQNYGISTDTDGGELQIVEYKIYDMKTRKFYTIGLTKKYDLPIKVGETKKQILDAGIIVD